MLRLPEEVINLQISERNPVGEKEVICIINYMNEIVRPYLAMRNHLNATIWMEVKYINSFKVYIIFSYIYII